MRKPYRKRKWESWCCWREKECSCERVSNRQKRGMGTSSKRCSMDHNIKIRIEAGEKLSREEAAQLLETAVGSRDYYELLYFANQYSRQVFEEKGLIFAQIGLDLQPCGINCKFCSMAKDSMCGKDDFVRSLEKVVEEAKAL